MNTIKKAEKFLRYLPLSETPVIDHWDVHLNPLGQEKLYYGIQRALLHVIKKYIRSQTDSYNQTGLGTSARQESHKNTTRRALRRGFGTITAANYRGESLT